MHAYVVVPILACTLSAATALAVVVRDPVNRRAWPIAGVSACAALWAFCEIAWSTATTPESALYWMRLSSLGWVPIGPIAFHALLLARNRDTTLVRAAIGLLYAVSGALLMAALASPVVISHATTIWWGWSPVPGPGMLLQYVVTAGSVGAGLLLGWRGGLAGDETRQISAVRIAIGVPLVVASLTDVILPQLGVFAVPRLGTLSLALIGGVHFWTFVRYGDSILVPEGLTARVLRVLPDGMASLSMKGHVRGANERLAAMLALPPEELPGRLFGPFLSLDPFDPPRELHDVECRLLPVQGAPVDVSLTTLLIPDKRGRPSGFVLILRDLREVVALRSRLITSGRMAAVGELAAGIAHELNNPIAYVRANLSTLRQHVDTLRKELTSAPPHVAPLLADAEEIVEESLEGMDRAAEIVRDVREFSHAGSGARQVADLRDLIEQSARVARLQTPRGADVEIVCAGLPPLECEPQRLKQLFLNLLVNAGQAIRDGGHIVVSGERHDGGVLLRFRDDGAGIPAEHIERIFDPFFTTKPVGVGTGLGLAIAFRIVEEHAGRIEVNSEPGAGTEFRVWLPIGVGS